MGFRVQGSGFRVQGLGFGAQGSGFGVRGSGFRVQGAGCKVFASLVGADKKAVLVDKGLPARLAKRESLLNL